MLEAALVLPILLVLVLGLTDICLYFWNVALVSKTAQTGARRAVVSDPVAVGPGLDAAAAVEFWRGLPPGSRCYVAPGQLSRACPDFRVVCDAGGCRCTGNSCMFRFAENRLASIVVAMRGILPDLAAGNVEVTYATSGFGYVVRPGPIPVEVEVTVKNRTYRPLFLHAVMGNAVSLSASARLPSESLASRP